MQALVFMKKLINKFILKNIFYLHNCKGKLMPAATFQECILLTTQKKRNRQVNNENEKVQP